MIEVRKIHDIPPIMAKYDRIGRSYNQTRMADPYLVSRMIALLKPLPEERFVDLGCGTGNYTIELAKWKVKVVGIDPSIEMLEKAKNRNSDIIWKKGVAENIELEAHSIDGVVAWLTTHHWTDVDQGFKEIARILKPNGRLLIFTSTPEQMDGYWLKHYFPNMMRASALKMLSEHALEDSLNSAGLRIEYSESYHVRPDLKDQFLQCGKFNPRVYFKPEIRQGISSFSAIANEVEVIAGLETLSSDLDSKRFKSISSGFNNDLGDYLFIRAHLT